MQPLNLFTVSNNMNQLKSLLIMASFCLFSQSINAQDIVTNRSEYQSLFNPLSIRGNIGLHTGALNLTNNKLILKSGGSVAIILNHTLALGASGNGFAGSQALSLGNDKYSIFGGYARPMAW